MNRISALRESLRSADQTQEDSFSEVFGEFFDLTESAEFMAKSRPTKDGHMRALLEGVARRHANDPNLLGVQMLHYAPADLFHGAFFAGQPGTFFYFMKEQQGIVAFAAGMSLMQYYRITATTLPPGTVLGRKPSGVS